MTHIEIKIRNLDDKQLEKADEFISSRTENNMGLHDALVFALVTALDQFDVRAEGPNIIVKFMPGMHETN